MRPTPLPRQEFDDIDPAEGRIDRLLHALITEGFVEPLPNNGNRFRLTRAERARPETTRLKSRTKISPATEITVSMTDHD